MNEGNQLQGIIIRGALIGALAGDGQFINSDRMVEAPEEFVEVMGELNDSEVGNNG